MTEKEAVRKALKARGMTQMALAQECGYPRQSNFTGIMGGKTMNVTSFVKFMNAMGYDVQVKDRRGDSRCKPWIIDMVSEAGDAK